MGKKVSENNTRKLVRLGKTSLAVTISRYIILELGWREKHNMVVKNHGKDIVITDRKE